MASPGGLTQHDTFSRSEGEACNPLAVAFALYENVSRLYHGGEPAAHVRCTPRWAIGHEAEKGQTPVARPRRPRRDRAGARRPGRARRGGAVLSRGPRIGPRSPGHTHATRHA